MEGEQPQGQAPGQKKGKPSLHRKVLGLSGRKNDSDGGASPAEVPPASSSFPAGEDAFGLADLLLLLYDGSLPMGPDRNEFTQSLARTVTRLVEKRPRIPPSENHVPLPPTAAPTSSSSPSGSIVSPSGAELTFSDVLSHPDLSQSFREYLAKAYCGENLELYELIDEFRKLWPQDASDQADPKEKQAMIDAAAIIWNKYLKPGSELQVHVDSDVVGIIDHQLQSPCTSMFDAAQSAVRQELIDGLFGRYLRSPDFKIALELAQLKDRIQHEQIELRLLIDKVANSERELSKLEKRKREIESQLKSTNKSRVSRPTLATLAGLDDAQEAIDKPASLRTVVSTSIETGTKFSRKDTSAKGIKKKEKRSLSADSANKKLFPNLNRVLFIGVIEAKQLVQREKEAGLNPYVVVKFGKHKQQTSVATLTERSVRWREYFSFTVGKEDEGNKLKIKVRNHSVLGGQTLGKLTFASLQMLPDKTDQWYPLEARKEGDVVTGKLRLETHFRKQGRREQELRKTLKQLKKAISEEESEIIKDEQLRNRSHDGFTSHLVAGTLIQPWSPVSQNSIDDDEHASRTTRRRSAMVIMSPNKSYKGLGASSPLSASPNSPTNRVLKHLLERKAKVEKELHQLDAYPKSDRAPTSSASKSSGGTSESAESTHKPQDLS